ncbi:Unknown protein, partial [Striga hermonthica]
SNYDERYLTATTPPFAVVTPRVQLGLYDNEDHLVEKLRATSRSNAGFHEVEEGQKVALLHRYNDPVQCRAFLTTLRGPAQDWFHQLPPRAVRDFNGFSSSFLNQFASVKAQEKSYLTLIGMQQKEGESLRDYVARYTGACVDVPSATEEIKSGGLTRGLLPGLCRKSLAKRPGRTFDKVLGRCAKYMNVEEAEADFLQAAKAKALPDPREEKKDKKPSSA